MSGFALFAIFCDSQRYWFLFPFSFFLNYQRQHTFVVCFIYVSHSTRIHTHTGKKINKIK